MIINSNPSYKPKFLKGEGWMEIGGKSAQSFLRALNWVKTDSSERLRNRVVEETGDRLETDILPIYRGSVNGRVTGVLFGNVNAPYRMYSVEDDKAADRLIAEIKRNKGFTDQQIEIVGEIYQNNEAQALYSWEGKFFGYKNLSQIARLTSISMSKAKKLVEGTNAEILDKVEAVDLAKKLAKKHGVYNLDFDFIPFDGRLLGYVEASEDGITPGIMPYGVNMRINSAVIYQHTILHEFAHAIELFHNGLSGHGENFRKIYRKILKDEDLKPTGL